MMKYSAVILLFAAAVFWSSASARPRHNPADDDVIDAFTRWAIEEMDELPEPHKTSLTNKLHEAQRQHWNDIGEYMTYVRSMLVRYVRAAGIDISRRKREIDSGSDESFEIDTDVNTEAFYKVYARVLIAVAPPAQKSILEARLEEATEMGFETFEDFEQKANEIFEEVTGLDLAEIEAKYDADAEKLAELESEVYLDVINHL